VAQREQLGANASLGGSYDSDDIQDYYQTRGTSGTAK